MKLNIPQRYSSDIENAVRFLKSEGCSAVYLFGSLVTGNVREGSDIDIGVMGLAPRKFFRTYASLDRALSNRVDLVDFDLQKDFHAHLETLKEVVQIG